MKSAPGIAFDYRPCRGLAVALVGVTSLAVIAVGLADIGLIAQLLIAAAALSLAALALQRHLGSKTVRIARGSAGWMLVDRAGVEMPAILHDHVRRGFLLVLGFREEGGQVRRFVLTPMNCSADLRRRLLLVLATERNPTRTILE